MAIQLLPIAAATGGSGIIPGARTFGTTRTASGGIFPLGTAPYRVGEVIGVVLNTTTSVPDFPTSQLVQIRTSPAQFIADGIVLGLGAVSGTTTVVNVQITSVTTPRDGTAILALTLRTLAVAADTPAVPPTAVNTTIPAGTSGFVQTIYAGNVLASNSQERSLVATIGTAPNTTVYTVRPGVPLPAGAVINNAQAQVYNILINN